jgi:hypothetical protein
VNTIKTLWASVQGDPVFMRRVNGWMTVFWIAMIPVSLLTGWINSVTYVAGLSLWALVSGHWSAWQAARVEVEQQREIQEREANPTEQRVVEELVKQTTIEPAASSPLAEGASGPPDHGPLLDGAEHAVSAALHRPS